MLRILALRNMVTLQNYNTAAFGHTPYSIRRIKQKEANNSKMHEW